MANLLHIRRLKGEHSPVVCMSSIVSDHEVDWLTDESRISEPDIAIC